VARALIVGCGCRGRELGAALLAEGWMVRGTSRDPARLPEIESRGIEPALADPDRAATLVHLVGDVTVIYWLLGSATGDQEALAALHGPRLKRLCEEIVDTPVRGLVYEAAGRVDPAHLRRGAEIVRAAGKRWRIPFETTVRDPGDPKPWVEEMLGAARRLTG
jgi:uncharacterized protein YbjT (DUF2867 family)